MKMYVKIPFYSYDEYGYERLHFIYSEVVATATTEDGEKIITTAPIDSLSLD